MLISSTPAEHQTGVTRHGSYVALWLTWDCGRDTRRERAGACKGTETKQIDPSTVCKYECVMTKWEEILSRGRVVNRKYVHDAK